MATYRIAPASSLSITLYPWHFKACCCNCHGAQGRRSKQRLQMRRATADGDTPAHLSTSSSAPGEEKEDLSAKLAAAEAEAQALRRELAARRSGRGEDLSKLKPAIPVKRIDGTGYRETLFSGPGKARTGTIEQQFSKWGLSEAELFLSKGAPTEGAGLGVPAMEQGSTELVKRRLIIGVGLAIAAAVLSFVKFPTSRPSKPFFYYLSSILRLRNQLQSIENDFSSDVYLVQAQLRKAYQSPGSVKEEFLSAAACLDDSTADEATALAYSILEYLDQADYNKYFDNFAQPTSVQQVEFLQFSLQAIKAAKESIDQFLRLAPLESLEAAQGQVQVTSS